jgi:hypothetical protein
MPKSNRAPGEVYPKWARTAVPQTAMATGSLVESTDFMAGSLPQTGRLSGRRRKSEQYPTLLHEGRGSGLAIFTETVYPAESTDVTLF